MILAIFMRRGLLAEVYGLVSAIQSMSSARKGFGLRRFLVKVLPMDDVNLLFVCTGNTCRSPMAEGLFRKAAEGKGYRVSSAGVSAYNGSTASPETLEILAENKAPIDGFASRMVDEKILEEASHVFCLTNGHFHILQQMFPEHQEKLYLVTEFAEIDGQVGGDISDPIGCGRRAYEEVARQLDISITGILGFLEVEAKSAKD